MLGDVCMEWLYVVLCRKEHNLFCCIVNNCVNKQSKTKKGCNEIVDNDATSSIH